MPFGKKPDGTGRTINFDAVYQKIIKPAIEAAELEPIRADEEIVGGFIHKPMFERLMLCDYAVADLTTANANVFYELGIRHGIRPYSTVTVIGKGTVIPFDVVMVRALSYAIDTLGNPELPDQDRIALSKRLIACHEHPLEDSPLFQLITDWPKPDLQRLKTDTFRDRVEYERKYKLKLERAREGGVVEVQAVEGELNINDADPAIVVDLFLSYRAVEAWQEMIDLAERMSPVLARTVMLREQHAFALNRLGRREEAERILKELIGERGPNSETNGLLGRVLKDRWKDALAAGRVAEARGHLRRAIKTYLDGFYADFRDAYPGINAATLMEFEETVSSEQAAILPVISFAVKRRLESKSTDYWDHATLLELRVLERNPKGANEALADALASCREVWELGTTADNLRLIIDARNRRREDVAWVEGIEAELRNRVADWN